MEGMKYKAIKYIRLSIADENPGESDSVTNQRRIIDEYLKNHPEIEIVGEKVDDGYSGIIFERPAFQEMMDEIKSGKVNCCVTKDLSRFGREYIETGRYLRQIFPTLGVRFIAINDNIDTLTDKGDDLALSLKTMLNDAYCRDISIKTRSSLDSKRETGDYVGSFPIYGYKKSDENRNKLVVDEYPAGIVREIYSMKMDGMSAVRIADILNERGVLSPYRYKVDRGLPRPKNGFSDKEDGKWTAKTILQMLKNETYTGTLVQGKSSTPNYKLKEVFQKPKDEWKRFENAHEAIIKKNVFDLTQKILMLDTRTSPHSDTVYLFSGLLICGGCGSCMTRKSVPYKDMKYHYYGCPKSKKSGCKGSAMLKEDELTEVVLISLKSQITNVTSLEAILEQLDADSISQEIAKNLAVQITENERRLEEPTKAIASLYENMMSGIITKEERRKLEAEYTKDVNNLKEANERLKKEIDDVLSCKHERMAWVEHFKNFSDMNELSRKMVVNLIQHIRVIGKNDIEIAFNYQAEYETALAAVEGGMAQ